MNFSIVICNYNYGRFLGAAIESCLSQDYVGGTVEVVVVDDGSKDESHEVLECYAGRPGLRTILQPNRGQGAALAAGVAAATGDYVCLLDSDDFFDASKLRRLYAHIDAIRPAGDLFLCHDVRLYDHAASTTIDQTWFEAINLAGAPAAMTIEQCDHQFPFSIPCGQVYSRPLVQRVFDALPGADWRYAADSPIAHTAFLDAGVVHYLHETLACYRIHGANDLAGLENGRYRPRADWKSRVPSMIAHVERYLSTLSDDGAERHGRIAYLKNKERSIRVTSPLRRFAAPQLGFVVDARARPHALARTLATLDGQTYPNTKTLILGSRDTPGLQEIDRSRTELLAQAPVTHAKALERLDCSFVCLLEAGIELAPTFATRQIEAHQYAGLVHAAYCNGRPTAATNASAFALLGQHSEQLAAFGIELRRLALPTLNAAVLRHTKLLHALVSTAEVVPTSTGWKRLLGTFLHALSGSVFVGEYLAAAQSPHVGDLLFPYSPPETQDLHELWRWYCVHRELLDVVAGSAWSLRFARWVMLSTTATDTCRMREAARSAGATDVLSLLPEVTQTKPRHS